jgi:NAD(P)-dependent dehydrogenase (short-subunit alcohol dehydrogenase family)
MNGAIEDGWSRNGKEKISDRIQGEGCRHVARDFCPRREGPVNCVAPGAIEIERMKKEVADFAKSWSQLTPLRRIGTPDDVAAAVEFPLSDRASHMTLQYDGAANARRA